jgi:hypothetical protein
MSPAMSFMNTKNNRGPRTDRWGTPAFKSSNSDNASLIATFDDTSIGHYSLRRIYFKKYD